jgi:hypothetical protein
LAQLRHQFAGGGRPHQSTYLAPGLVALAALLFQESIPALHLAHGLLNPMLAQHDLTDVQIAGRADGVG